MLEILLSFAISLLIGLMIGIEREHSHVEKIQPIGVRTFVLLSLVGTIIAILSQLVLTITLSAFVFSIILLSYFRSTTKLRRQVDLGITTEVSAGMVFCLGYMVPSNPLIAITISAIVLLILIERQRLHTLARRKFKPHEIETAIILIIFALGILPILPNRTIDSWQLFNPRNFGILVATIATIQFGGYIVIRLLGERFGIAITGFLGGLVSSTAVFASLSDTLNNHPKFILATIASAILATIAMLLSVMIILLVASPTLFTIIIWPELFMIAIGSLFAIFLIHYQEIKKHPAPILSNPLSILSIIRTSILIGATLVLIALAKRYVGTEGILLISFLGGLFEIQGVALAISLLFLGNQLTIHNASSAIYIAIIAGFVSKFFMLWSLTPHRFALQTSFFLLGILVSGVIVYWLTTIYLIR